MLIRALFYLAEADMGCGKYATMPALQRYVMLPMHAGFLVSDSSLISKLKNKTLQLSGHSPLRTGKIQSIPLLKRYK
jgi:hypothetical protein